MIPTVFNKRLIDILRKWGYRQSQFEAEMLSLLVDVYNGGYEDGFDDDGFDENVFEDEE